MYHCVVHRRRRMLNFGDDLQHNDSVLLLMAAYKLFSILAILYNIRAVPGHLAILGDFLLKKVNQID